MNRREWLGAIAGAFTGMAFDPERALWRPREKLISIPKPRDPRIIRAGEFLNVKLGGVIHPHGAYGVRVELEDPSNRSRTHIISLNPIDGASFYMAPTEMRVIGYEPLYYNLNPLAKISGVEISKDLVVGHRYNVGI